MIAKLWKEPKCPSTDEWIKKLWYTMEYYSAIKKNGNLATCNVKGTRACYAKQNKSEKDKYHMILLMWNLRNTKDEHRGREAKIR